MKILTAATAISCVLIASPLVMAQTQPSPTQPSPSTAPPATAPKTTTSPDAGMPSWYSHQQGEMRASKLIGTTVRNSANESIGDINEIVLSKDGKVAAVVVGVGGFLGIGEREVAISFDSLRMTRDNDGDAVVTVNATKDSLRNAPQWTWRDDSRTTTGTGGATGTGGRTGTGTTNNK